MGLMLLQTVKQEVTISMESTLSVGHCMTRNLFAPPSASGSRFEKKSDGFP